MQAAHREGRYGPALPVAVVTPRACPLANGPSHRQRQRYSTAGRMQTSHHTGLFLVLFEFTVTRKNLDRSLQGLKDPSFSGQSLYAAVHVALWLYRLLEQADFWLSVKKKTKSLAQV